MRAHDIDLREMPDAELGRLLQHIGQEIERRTSAYRRVAEIAAATWQGEPPSIARHAFDAAGLDLEELSR